MSRADFILDLVVKAAPYRDILSGIKPEEYRANKDGEYGWAEKLVSDRFKYSTGLPWSVTIPKLQPHNFHPYHTARISLGYASDRPSHLRKIRGIRWGAPNPVWCYGIVTAEKCFIIELGEIIA